MALARSREYIPLNSICYKKYWLWPLTFWLADSVFIRSTPPPNMTVARLSVFGLWELRFSRFGQVGHLRHTMWPVTKVKNNHIIWVICLITVQLLYGSDDYWGPAVYIWVFPYKRSIHLYNFIIPLDSSAPCVRHHQIWHEHTAGTLLLWILYHFDSRNEFSLMSLCGMR